VTVNDSSAVICLLSTCAFILGRNLAELSGNRGEQFVGSPSVSARAAWIARRDKP